MRNRYVKKCKCTSFPIITKSTEYLPKGVLDIELEVTCANCGKLFKEVNSKRTRMTNPETLKEMTMPFNNQSIFTDTEESETGEVDELDNGSDNIETGKSEEVLQQEEEQTNTPTENENPEDESQDEKRDSDEAGSPDPIETPPKPRRGRPPGKNKGTESAELTDVELAERPVGDALEDCGVPIGDLLA